jgi:asparagine synthase (glutamine-hydrolysing)
MCGIYALFQKGYIDFKERIKDVGTLLNHRGPDSLGHTLINIPNTFEHILLVHTRLQINGTSSSQPIKNKAGTIYLIINGEIFNWHKLEDELNYKCTQSDCEIIIPLYEKYKNTPNIIFEKLSGQFSFVLVDLEDHKIIIGRDHVGITPMYIGKSKDSVVVTSEIKTMTSSKHDEVNDIDVFFPRTFYTSSINDIYNFDNTNAIPYISLKNYNSLNCNYIENDDVSVIHSKINDLLTNSVKSQLVDMLDNVNGDFGVLLSGGLDSSLIASLVVKLSKNLGYNNYNKKIKTFSIGVNKDSPDLKAARVVSQYLDTEHYEYYFSIEEGLNNIKDVIWYVESYDCTTVRASTAMYLLTKKINKQHPKIKVLFSGELSDELLCYLYGANAPNDDAFQDETVQLVSNVHYFDCLRANKTCMANSLEVRVPFTDLDYIKYILSLHPRYKRFGNGVIEKKVLRDSFKGYLPDEILYRVKDQLSDGVSGFDKEFNWIDNLKKFTEEMYTESDFQKLKKDFTYTIPRTNEELYYRIIFNELFSKKSDIAEYTVKRWVPKWSNTLDPSGRKQEFFIESIKNNNKEQ